jgi:hypothetical protein
MSGVLHGVYARRLRCGRLMLYIKNGITCNQDRPLPHQQVCLNKLACLQHVWFEHWVVKVASNKWRGVLRADGNLLPPDDICLHALLQQILAFK